MPKRVLGYNRVLSDSGEEEAKYDDVTKDEKKFEVDEEVELELDDVGYLREIKI